MLYLSTTYFVHTKSVLPLDLFGPYLSRQCYRTVLLVHVVWRHYFLKTPTWSRYFNLETSSCNIFSNVKKLSCFKGGFSSTDLPIFCTSKIGARVMKLKGYWYTRHSVCASKVKWLCADSRVMDCHAIVVTIGRTTVHKQNRHSHPPTLN